MTKEEIAAMIAAKIEGQGTNVDAGSALPAILNGILELIPEAYTLPVANNETLGGVKVGGNGLNVDSDGFIELTAQSQADIYEDDKTSPNFIKGIFHENRSPVDGKIELSKQEFNEAQISPFLVFAGASFPRLNPSSLLETYIHTGFPDAAIVAIFGVYYEDNGSIESASLYTIAQIDDKYYLLASEA